MRCSVSFEVSGPEPLAAPLHHRLDAQTRGVGGHHAVGLHQAVELGEERLLRLQPLDDGLDHQVAVLHLVQVVLDVADRDQAGEAGVHEGSGPPLHRLLQAARREAVAGGAVVLALLVEIGRDDVEQQDVHTGVGEVRGDPAAHHAAADHGCAPDGGRHGGEPWRRSAAEAR
jgi:hypothetical protein